MYCELHCKTNFSFLTGASHADELVERAAELEYAAIAVTDENTLAGIVRAWKGARKTPLKLIVGAELIVRDAPPVVVWTTNRRGYGNLCKLLTLGRRRAPKGECWLEVADIAALNEGLLAGIMPGLHGQRDPIGHLTATHADSQWFDRPIDLAKRKNVTLWKDVWGDRCWLLAELARGVDDASRIEELQRLAKQTLIPLVAAGDVLYHIPERKPLHDILSATRYQTTVHQAGDLLLPNAWRHLHSVADRVKQFERIPEALEATLQIADQCNFRLDELRYEYPRELAPAGMTPLEFLRKLTWQGVETRWPGGVPDKVRTQIEHELGLIEELGYEPYFLTVWDLVRFARQRNILCQGRGSAANSAVCYALEITNVDPSETELLFERFISRERNEVPDIDVDFEHERREEVLQYLYEKYGRERAGLAATVITYRTRSAVRDVGKALGLSLDRINALCKQVDGYHTPDDLTLRCREVGIDPETRSGKQLCYLVHELLGFPRHLSQHVGGMVMTEGSLDELVPIENAAMDGRTVIQWDKDDLEELGLLKVDCLCLGMLTAIRKAFDLIEKHWGERWTLATIPPGDKTTYDMICRADTIGVFQIESRGQMSMLPRLKPTCWYDLVIEVAIVRPGPIQGKMVHPYLKRRNGEEPVRYPNEAIRQVLERTLGIPLFQEQAMRLAVVAAGFTPGEADQLRRAMGTFRSQGVIEKFRLKMMAGMKERGLSEEFANAVFQQVRGFGEYGFPESHAASFALLVYVSAWLKAHFPAPFTAALLNSQPMGFYAPPQLIADARRHDVVVLPPDVNHSEWNCTLEKIDTSTADRFYRGTGETPVEPREPTTGETPVPRRDWALRLGLRMVSGMSESASRSIEEEREKNGLFESVSEFTKRTGLQKGMVKLLSKADAFSSFGQNRRNSLWQALGQEQSKTERPLFAALDDEDDGFADALPSQPMEEAIAADYRTIGLSLRGHPMQLHREGLRERFVVPAGELLSVRDGSKVLIAGLVIIRQRPSTAKGITFVTLEDETGTANLVVKPHVWERYRSVCRLSPVWLAEGIVENRSGVIHVVVSKIEDISQKIASSDQVRSRNFH